MDTSVDQHLTDMAAMVKAIQDVVDAMQTDIAKKQTFINATNAAIAAIKAQ